MQTLTNLDGLSLYLVADDAPLLVREDAAYIGNPLLIVPDMRQGFSMIVEGITPPADWQSGRYFLIDGEWSLNEDWQEPIIEPEAVSPSMAIQAFKQERQARLSETDWWAIRASEPDGTPMTDEQVAYRAALRTMDDAEDFDPFNITWPTKPE